MNDVVAADEPRANRIQCPTSNSWAVCFRKVTEWTAVPSVNMIVFRGQKKAIENSPSQTITIRLPIIQYLAGFTPGKDQGPDTCDPTDETEGREEVARTPTVANAIAVSSEQTSWKVFG